MGYSTRPNSSGGAIQSYWPDDTDTEIYLDGGNLGFSLADIVERASEKWPNASADSITITSEYIQTDCLGYDLHDSSDWTLFIVIRLIKSEGWIQR